MILTLKQAVELKIDINQSLEEILLDNAYPAITIVVNNQSLLEGLKNISTIDIAEQTLSVVGVVLSDYNIYTVYAMPDYIIRSITDKYNILKNE